MKHILHGKQTRKQNTWHAQTALQVVIARLEAEGASAREAAAADSARREAAVVAKAGAAGREAQKAEAKWVCCGLHSGYQHLTTNCHL